MALFGCCLMLGTPSNGEHMCRSHFGAKSRSAFSTPVMADEDFDFDVAESVGPTPSPAKSQSGRKAGGSSAGSSMGGGQSVDRFCIFGDCDDVQKKGSRFCHHHTCHFANMRAQVAVKHGVEGAKTWTEQCKNDEFAISQVQYMSKQCIASSAFKRKPLIAWAEWQEMFGIELSKTETSQTAPFEEQEWILRQVGKYGRDKAHMESEWKQHVASSWKRDNNGFKGAIRLWLPKKQFIDNSKKTFITSGTQERSSALKNPNDIDRDALRRQSSEHICLM